MVLSDVDGCGWALNTEATRKLRAEWRSVSGGTTLGRRIHQAGMASWKDDDWKARVHIVA